MDLFLQKNGKIDSAQSTQAGYFEQCLVINIFRHIDSSCVDLTGQYICKVIIDSNKQDEARRGSALSSFDHDPNKRREECLF